MNHLSEGVYVFVNSLFAGVCNKQIVPDSCDVSSSPEIKLCKMARTQWIQKRFDQSISKIQVTVMRPFKNKKHKDRRNSATD